MLTAVRPFCFVSGPTVDSVLQDLDFLVANLRNGLDGGGGVLRHLIANRVELYADRRERGGLGPSAPADERADAACRGELEHFTSGQSLVSHVSSPL
jgi:hypothetical protein